MLDNNNNPKLNVILITDAKNKVAKSPEMESRVIKSVETEPEAVA